jgi:hypothetical protein
MSEALVGQQTMPSAPPPSLIFEMAADIAILQTVVASLAHTNAPALAAMRDALAQLAVTSVQVGQQTPLVQIMNDTMQRRIFTFEARLPRPDPS